MKHSPMKRFDHTTNDFHAANQNLHFFGVFDQPANTQPNRTPSDERGIMTQTQDQMHHSPAKATKTYIWHGNAFTMTNHQDDFAGYSRAYEVMKMDTLAVS